MIRSLRFDGFRSFACTRQYDQTRPLQRLDLAPLTLIVGRNNAGKSSVATLLHQVLGGLAGLGASALPLTVAGQSVADGFQDLLHARDATTFLELEVTLEFGMVLHELSTVLYLRSLLDEDSRPWARSIMWEGKSLEVPDGPLEGGLAPNVLDQKIIRAEAQRTLDVSVWLGPLRDRLPETPGPVDQLRPEQVIDASGGGVIRLLADDEALFKSVSDWLREHAGLSLRWEKNLDLWLLKVVRGDVRSISITQVGAGIHQLVPVLTLALLRQLRRGSASYIDVVQQPELHLHDALHPALGDLFIRCAEMRQGVTLVETHAEGLLLRVRRRIAEGRIPADLVALYYVDDAAKGSELRRIEILDNGDVSYWPEGVFLESLEEVKALRRAQRTRA